MPVEASPFFMTFKGKLFGGNILAVLCYLDLAVSGQPTYRREDHSRVAPFFLHFCDQVGNRGFAVFLEIVRNFTGQQFYGVADRLVLYGFQGIGEGIKIHLHIFLLPEIPCNLCNNF